MNQSGIYGHLITHLTSLLQPNFEVGVLLPANSGIISFVRRELCYKNSVSHNMKAKLMKLSYQATNH
ncbi:hypothetical protein CN907_10355 [Bacillus anthracis]|nr:hypothetical protein CN907_10355 [Bacillus anthracis]